MFTLLEITAAVRGELRGGAPALEVGGVSSDSRTLSAGDLFVALRGPSFDGHTFVEAARARGAVAALVEESAHVPSSLPLVLVKDTLQALGDLAIWYRHSFGLDVVAVTGSAGKTSTKEMIASILSRRGPTLATRGNLNNLIGLPLTLFQLRREHRYAVLEMGMSVPGEIARLATIAWPKVGIITLVAAAHTQGVGGIEGVARAKGELFDRLDETAFAVVNLDDPYIGAMRPRARVVSFGRAAGADVRLISTPQVTLSGTRARVSVAGTEIDVALPHLGAHQMENALGAMAAALCLNIPLEDMIRGLAATPQVPGRMTVRAAGERLVLDDTYNANPRSTAVALDTLAAVAAGRRTVAVLGDMLELGPDSARAHREVGEIAGRRAAALFAFGAEAREIAAGARAAGLGRIYHTTDAAEMAKALREGTEAGDVILVKGSRGMRMERFLSALGAAAKNGEGH
jgi:UDP-N-acetylmuramoyl-tripeptide--D-alanyl-D-alanine ligase